MNVKKTLETPDGGVTFEGEINSQELDLILSVGLNFLFQQGAIPFHIMPKDRQMDIHAPVEVQQ